MSTPADNRRILALDVRPHSFGYAVMEGPAQMLAWGAKRFPGGVNARRVPARRRLAALLEEFLPAAVVLKQTAGKSPRGRMQRTVLRQAAIQKVPMRSVTLLEMEKAFAGHTQNKYELGLELAARCPDLAWRLPPKRKLWQSEDYRTSLFDAAAVGLTYFASRQAKDEGA